MPDELVENDDLDLEIDDLNDDNTDTSEPDEQVDEDVESEETDESKPKQVEGQDDPEPTSRATRRVQALKRERDEERQQRKDLEQRLSDALQAVGRRVQDADPERARQDREAKLAIMEPHERDKFLSDERIQALEARLVGLSNQGVDSEDRIRFQLKAESSAIYAKYQPVVETKLADLRAKGINAQREAILKFLIGEQYLKKAEQSKPKPKQQVRESGNLIQARGKAPSGRSDAQISKGGKSLAQKLDGVPL